MQPLTLLLSTRITWDISIIVGRNPQTREHPVAYWRALSFCKGHHIENPAYRDTRKKYACQQASLPLVTFYFKDDKNAEIEENNKKLEEVSRILLSHSVRK